MHQLLPDQILKNTANGSHKEVAHSKECIKLEKVCLKKFFVLLKNKQLAKEVLFAIKLKKIV